MMSPETALEIVDIWLSAKFEGGRHKRRIEQLEGQGAEKKNYK
jgi:ribose 5-phosphate isomerase RpiB